MGKAFLAHGYIEFYALHAAKNNDMDFLVHAKDLSGLDVIQFYMLSA